MNDGATTRETVDLTNCDREPIHIPGSIQPHGVLLAFVEPSLEIVAASGNGAQAFGVPAEGLVGRTLGAIIAADDVARVVAHRAEEGRSGLDAFPLRTTGDGAARTWTALVHRHEGLGILELEPVNAPAPGPSTLLRVGAAAQKLQDGRDLVESCAIVAEQVRDITGFDRVKIYRFAADWSGEVLAEARDDAMPSYLGLHFPASDIPAQARALYASNPVRLIADVHYRPAPVLPDRNPATGGPIDLRFATLRSVSPIHLEYLRNMGVGASMSASILRNGRLWGLIACHHRSSLLVDFERRQACALLAQLLAARLDAQERVERARRSVHVEGLRAGMLRAASDGRSVPEAIEAHGARWMSLIGATGFALVRPGQIVVAGRAPEARFLERLTHWLAASSGGEPVVLDRLGAVHAPAVAHAAIASGVLAVPLSRAESSFLLWFRPEQRLTVTWAGRPEKIERAVDEGKVLDPRQSFDAWSEEVRGRALPWTEQDVAAALQLREMVLDLTVREKDVLERQNVRLAISARELETFIYVASHDIKEPLRQMEMLTSLLREFIRPDAEVETSDYFREFGVVANRLRILTDELAEYAKLGRSEPGLQPVILDDLLEEVGAALQPQVDAAQGRLEIDRLPVVLGERAQLHQVFANLVGNAIKYRDPERPIVVRVTASRHAAPADDALARPMARITVADNGIGFDPKYGEKVFEAFWRLHSRDRYEGSGIGLAICRRIVERHGGRIEAVAEAGRGATFTFTLPLADGPGSPS